MDIKKNGKQKYRCRLFYRKSRKVYLTKEEKKETISMFVEGIYQSANRQQ